MSRVAEQADTYQFRRNDKRTETTVWYQGSPIYRFGTNPAMDEKDYQDTCEYYASLLGRVLKTGY